MPLAQTPQRLRSAAHKAIPVVGTMLLAVGALALLSKAIPVDLESFVLAALLPLVIARLPRARSAADQARDCGVVMGTAVVAVELPALIAAQPLLGTAALIGCAVGSKWLRGRSRALGIAAVGAGLAVRLALISLVAPGDDHIAQRALLAIGLVALVYLCWAGLNRLRGRSLPPRAATTAVSAQRAARTAQRRSATLQMLLAFSASCLFGRWLFAAHWNWAALSTFLVLTGPLNRAEVLNKGLHRLVGAAAGTVAAAALAGPFGAGSRSTLLALLVVVVVSIGLRSIAYAGWVAGITAALSLLYSYEGQDAGALLGIRLMALAAGALLAIGAGWFVSPVHPSREPDAG
ncbi:MAG: hypothetical protein JSR49_11875 [Proteobacteria bacterium]|nr:hypothetical protein [Pseudomonadota bacterium]